MTDEPPGPHVRLGTAIRLRFQLGIDTVEESGLGVHADAFIRDAEEMLR